MGPEPPRPLVAVELDELDDIEAVPLCVATVGDGELDIVNDQQYVCGGKVEANRYYKSRIYCQETIT